MKDALRACAAAWVALATFPQVLSAPAFFPRAQFHYGLERTDYLHRWYDRPLCQDSTFADANDPAHPINEKSWRETVRALRLGKCGIGTFIESGEGAFQISGGSEQFHGGFLLNAHR